MSKFLGVSLMLLGGIGFLFFSSLFLVYAINIKYFSTESWLPSELSELLTRLFSINPTDDINSLEMSSIFGVSLFTGMPFTDLTNFVDYTFAISIVFMIISLTLFLTSLTAIFSPLSLGFVMGLSFLISAAVMVGGIFPEKGDFTVIKTTSLPGLASLFSPIFAMFIGGFFQMIYFSMRKKYYRT